MRTPPRNKNAIENSDLRSGQITSGRNIFAGAAQPPLWRKAVWLEGRGNDDSSNAGGGGAKVGGTILAEGQAHDRNRLPHRPTIAVTRHAIAAGHYLAATAGFDILQAGGNAIDAGCAAGIALGVVAERPRRCRRCGADHDLRRRKPARSSRSPGSAPGPRRSTPNSLCASMAARSRKACCAPSSRPRPTPGLPRSSATAR